MAGRGPAPKDERRNPSDVPIRGEWQPTAGIGWQYGEIPKPPSGVRAAAKTAWQTWMQSWFAAHWTPDDLPGLRVVLQLYDQVDRGEYQRANELRLQMDTYGITPKGQQDRRWKRPVAESTAPETPKPGGKYSHLKVVNE